MSRLPSLKPLALAASIAIALANPAGAAPAMQDEAQAEYQDRIIAPDALEPLPPEEDEIVDTSGLPRSLNIELLLSRTERGDESFSEEGVSMGGFWETAELGSFSLDATLLHTDRARDGDRPWGGTATLWQRGLYLDGGWRANNGLGVLNTALPPLLRDQYRFFLPSVPLAGIATDWTQLGSKLQVQGSFGRAGVFDGTRVVGFDLADGDVASVAAQWQWAPQWTGSAAFLNTDGQFIPDEDGGVEIEDRLTRALAFATGWRDSNDSVTLNLQSSEGDLASAFGAWLDGRSDRGRYTHRYGLFRLEPDLAWGALPITNDAQGGYYRLAYQHARWSWNASLDRIESVSGNSFDGTYGNGYVRYQASTRLGYGGSLSVRDSSTATAYATQLFLDGTNPWGQTRLQFDQADDGGNGGDSWQVEVDHALPLKLGSRLSLSASYGELSYDGEAPTDTASVAAFGGFDLTDRISIDGSARYTRGSGPDAFRGTDLNLNLSWRLGTRWWLVASVYENQGEARSPFILDPLAPEEFLKIPRDRSYFLSLRHERRSGTPAMILGGTPGSAVGGIVGSVYLDDNSDGERNASELPAANVTVILDGRYSVRTDSQGNFEFPRVATGPHELVVIPDNLPLPWFFDSQDERRAVEVRVREQQRIDVGARRQR